MKKLITGFERSILDPIIGFGGFVYVYGTDLVIRVPFYNRDVAKRIYKQIEKQHEREVTFNVTQRNGTP